MDIIDAMNNVIENRTVETSFARFDLAKTTDGIFESHCGYDRGCFYTEPAQLMYPVGTSLDRVAQDLIDMYGAKE